MKGFLAFILNIYQIVESLNFYNTDDLLSYAEYPTWLDTVNGEATLEFTFKTDQLYAFLLSCDDGDEKKNIFRLTLDGGMLHVFFKMGDDDFLSTKELLIGSQWNDMEWHQVNVTRISREVIVQIDDHHKILTSEGNANNLILPSSVYVGGDPENIYQGLTGCIKDLAYPIGSYKRFPLRTIGSIHPSCLDTCNDHQRKLCKNRGRCMKHFNHKNIVCDCTGTGFTGNTCSINEKIGFLRTEAFISRTLESLQNYRVNSLQFRFRTNQPSGIIIFSNNFPRFLLVELNNGVLILKVSLGTGEVRLLVGEGELHDGKWHSVIVKRHGQRVSIRVDNNRFQAEGLFPYYPSEACRMEKDKVYIGGYSRPNQIEQSKSKMNFEGCLQQVYYQKDGFELINQAITARNNYTRVEGNILPSCPVQVQIVSGTQGTPGQTKNDEISPKKQTQLKKGRRRLSQSTVAWITGGICVGSIAMIFTLACGFHFMRRRYSGQFLATQTTVKKRIAGNAMETHIGDPDSNKPYNSIV